MKQFGIGQPVRRVEDRRFITGRGNYLDDNTVAGPVIAEPANILGSRYRGREAQEQDQG